MRNALFLAVGVLLILLQSTLYRVLEPLHVPGLNPSLVLPLVVFLGVHEHSMARGAMLSFLLGYFLDLIAGAPIGLCTFIYVAIWWMSRIAGVRLTAQSLLTRVSLGFIFTVVEATSTLILLSIFGTDTKRPVEIASTAVLAHAASTAFAAPFIFRIAQRVHQISLPAGSPEGGKQ